MSAAAEKSLKRKINRGWYPILCLLLFINAIILPDIVMAAAGPATSKNSMSSVFCDVVLIMVGTTGKAICTINIVAIGVGALLGKLTWNKAMLCVLAIGLIFGAASVVTVLSVGPGPGAVVPPGPPGPALPSTPGPVSCTAQSAIYK